MRLIGYARTASERQNISLQTDRLYAAGCERVFADVASFGRTSRSEFKAALQYIRPGDTLVVCNLYQVGKSLSHLVKEIANLGKMGITFRSLADNIDTSATTALSLFDLMSALIQFDTDLAAERTTARTGSGRPRGMKGGRPKSVTDVVLQKASTIVDLGWTVREAAARLGVSKSSLYAARRIEKLGCGTNELISKQMPSSDQ